MEKYRRIPVVVNAEQWDPINNNIWIVIGTKGERDPVEPNIFPNIYEEVEEVNGGDTQW